MKTGKRSLFLVVLVVFAGLISGAYAAKGHVSKYDPETKEYAYYYYDENEEMVTGWVNYNGYRYYFAEDGKRVSGWQTIDGEKYYFNGPALTGGCGIADPETGKTENYYFDAEGKMQTGWVTVNGLKYYYDSDGKRLEGWQTIDEETYYLNPVLLTGRQTIPKPDGSKYGSYYFDTDGKMQTGWASFEEKISQNGVETVVTRKYYYGKDGNQLTGWQEIDGDTYYLYPYMITGQRLIADSENEKSSLYYFGDDGKMRTGLVQTPEKKIFFFDKDGKAITGWKEVDNDWYYFTTYSYWAATGFEQIEKKKYFFDENGVMQTGWNDTGNSSYGWRYFGDNGAMVESFAGWASVEIPAKVKSLSGQVFRGIGREFVIICEPGSYAESFARRYGFQYDNGQKRVVGYTIRNVNEKVRWVVDNYTDSSMSSLEKVRALHDWLIYNAHYDTTYSIHGAEGVLIGGSGVCSSYAAAYQLLLDAAGIENIQVSGNADNGTGSGPQGHAWNLVRLGDNWYHVDCTWDDPTTLTKDDPIVSGAERYQYFLISDGAIGANHSWSARVSAPESIGWQGTPGWQKIGGKWVYYGSDGYLTIGAARIDGVLYGLGDDGRLMNAGWNKVGGVYYYAREGGILAEKTWIADGGFWYYLGEDGQMATGWLEDNGSWYYLDESGAMVTGWLLSGNTWYLMTESGAMATGWAKSGGSWYFFSDTGAMATGWIKDGGSWYFLADSGEMQTGWMQAGGYWFLLDGGAMQTGWVKQDGTWYWFDSNGHMATGWKEIDGQWEMFADSGAWLYSWSE